MGQFQNVPGPSQADFNTLSEHISTSKVSISDASTNLLSNISGDVSVSGGTAYIYITGTGLKSAGNNADLCTLKEKYRPYLSGGNYVILPLFSDASPYTPVGTVWLYTTGEVKKYGSANSGLYACGSYIINI